jgi:hypothetical protein
MSVSVQDATMHAPFAAEVEWNVRQSTQKEAAKRSVHRPRVALKN